MTARQADGMTGCREDGVTAYRGERTLGAPAVIQREGGAPEAKGDASDLPTVVFTWMRARPSLPRVRAQCPLAARRLTASEEMPSRTAASL
jgi:hypothetical protein